MRSSILKQRLQERIDKEPAIGTKLAARSVRIGNGGGTTSQSSGNRIPIPQATTVTTKSSNTNDNKNRIVDQQNELSKESNGTPIIGSVMERKTNRRQRTPRVIGCDPSSKQANHINAGNMTVNASPETGFPSIRKEPLGTFVVATPSSTQRVTTAEHQNAVQGHTISKDKTSTTNSLSNEYSNSDAAASTSSATTMLQQMSTQEIQESIQEIHSILKPETIEYLKNRSSRTNTVGSKQQQIGLNSDLASKESIGAITSEKSNNDSGMEHINNEELSGKLHMAQIMASIQSYDDIDTAYQEEYSKRHIHVHNNSNDKRKSKSSPNVILSSYNIFDEGIVNASSIDDTHLSDNSKADSETQFHIACTLLRSTSIPQTVWASRIVYQRLRYELATSTSMYNLQPIQHRHSSTSSSVIDWPFPVLLPVSLRCLLDESKGSKNVSQYIIQRTTYVLQSIFLLLQLRACSDHVVHFPPTGCNNDDCYETNVAKESSQFYYNNFYYQVDCLDDVIPTMPSRFCYSSTVGVPIDKSNKLDTSIEGASAAAIKTNSSSSNADGQSFIKDPMWTLLSTMRIIPRLAEIIQEGSKSCLNKFSDSSDTLPYLLPIEARRSICGILAMIAQRSSGAASAIVHHPTLLKNMMQPFFLGTGNEEHQQHLLDQSVLVPVLYLLCTLVRQSYIAAKGICEQIITSSSTHYSPSGLLLHVLLLQSDNISTLSTNGNNSPCTRRYSVAQQWSIILWRSLLRYGFGLDLLPSMLALSSSHITLGLVDASSSFSTNPAQSLAPEWYTCYATILRESSRHNDDNHNIVGQVASATFQRQAVHHIEKVSENSNLLLNEYEVIRLTSAILMYWNALLASMDTLNLTRDSDITSQVCNNAKLLICALRKILVNDKLNNFVASVFQDMIIDFEGSTFHANNCDLKLEARSITLLEELLNFIAAIKNNETATSNLDLLDEVKGLKCDLAKILALEFDQFKPFNIDGTNPIPVQEKNRRNSMHSSLQNRIRASLISFLYYDECTFDIRKMRVLSCTLIGRLDVGEERTAHKLFSLHKLFHPSTMNSHIENMDLPSSVSSVFLSELYTTPKNRKQLNHSCTLKYDASVGAASSSTGGFDLQSLLHIADDDPHQNNSDYLLPLGKYWLWKLLSGNSNCTFTETASGSDFGSATVLLSTLELIHDIETYYSENGSGLELSNSAKLYYLTNICLHGEAILSLDPVVSLASNLFDLYFYSNWDDDLSDMEKECLTHLDPKLSPNLDTNVSSLDEEQVKSILNPNANYCMRSMETYVGDLCDAYMDFGLHFNFFTKSIRCFLAKEFPTKVRIFLLNRFRSSMHLLSLEDDKTMAIAFLRRCLSGGMPSVDQSKRDDPELIDFAATLYANGYVNRVDDLIIKSWTVCLIARSLAISVATDNASGLSVSKRRIQHLDATLAVQVLNTSFLWLKADGSVQSLVTSAIQSSTDACDSTILPFDVSVICNIDIEWKEIVSQLKNTPEQLNGKKE